MNTIRSRIRGLRAEEVVRRRQGHKAAKIYKPIYGSFPETCGPLGVFQIDHTKMDVIVVDELARQPLGRPHLTIAIDVYSRCISGICLTLEAPSAVSVGLCLATCSFA